MSTNYLTEEDFTFQSNNDALKGKAEEITEFTSLRLLDFTDEDDVALSEKDVEFNRLKELLYDNTAEILTVRELDESDQKRKDLEKQQKTLLAEWAELGFTNGYFIRLYQVEYLLQNDEPSSIDRERLELLWQILNEQKTLILAFSVMYERSPSVLIDIEDFV